MASSTSFRYRAFISYSHQNPDGTWAAKLHSWLERYRTPADLTRRPAQAGWRREFRGTIFRDRDELPAGHAINDKIRETLRDSEFLIVVCSGNAANSSFVNAEVGYFKSLGRANHILPIVQPRFAGRTQDSFPLCLTRVCDAEGRPTEADEPPPVAADARPDRDGEERAKQKLVAGILGVNLGEIVKRFEQQRRRQMVALAAVAAVFAGLAASTALLGWYTYQNEKIAEENLNVAIKSVDGLVESTADLTQRYAVPQKLVQEMLTKADATLRELRGSESVLETMYRARSKFRGLAGNSADSDELRFHKARLAMALSDSYSKLARVDEQLNDAQVAVNLLEPLSEGASPDVKYIDATVTARYNLALAYGATKDRLRWRAQIEQALTQADDAMKRGTVPDTLRLSAAKLHFLRGRMLHETDEKANEPPLAQAKIGLGLLDSISDFGGMPPEAQESLSWAYIFAADLLRQLGHKAEALDTANGALEKLDAYLQAQPDSYEGRRAKANLLVALGDATRLEPKDNPGARGPAWKQSQLAALADYRESLSLRENLHLLDPEDASLILSTALVDGKIAEEMNFLEDYGCARIEAERARQFYMSLISLHPDWDTPKIRIEYALDPLVIALKGEHLYDAAVAVAQERAIRLKERGVAADSGTSSSKALMTALLDVAGLLDDRGRR